MAAPKMRGFVCVRDLRADCCDTYEAGGKGIPDRTFAVGYKGEISAEAAACATKGGDRDSPVPDRSARRDLLSLSRSVLLFMKLCLYTYPAHILLHPSPSGFLMGFDTMLRSAAGKTALYREMHRGIWCGPCRWSR